MKNKKIILIVLFIISGFTTFGCKEEGTGWTPDMIPDDPLIEKPGEEVDISDIHKFKAPLYWSVYEFCWQMAEQGIPEYQMDMSEAEWDKAIDWVAKDLKPYGYDMLCTDGFIPMLCVENEHGYMDKYGSMFLKDIIAKCKAKGLKLGVYDNPLWLHGKDETPIQNTNNITLGQLRYDPTIDEVIYPERENDTFFTWIIATHKGAKEYIDGFFKHYKEMGVEYIRMDFLSWYETGYDRGLGVVGRGYGKECYEKALEYICTSATRYGIFTSLVMPHLNNKAELERKYGNMVRIVADTNNGGWWHFSEDQRGNVFDGWPNCMNMFDGFVHWSQITDRSQVIPDGDFIRLSTFKTDAEKESVISLQLMAGGPVTVADQHNTIGDNLKFYQNEEILELNTDRFVGKPLLRNVRDEKSQIWFGQMTNGDYVVGLFNRDNESKKRSLEFSEIGIEGTRKVRDLWKHEDEGEADKLEVELGAHECKIVRLSK
ncbi:MAG TPA: glucan 1,6-alpha-isomaltosidase [Bacteroides reticulotermitis]|nr:glucan 1,6-alpha-isomaltosidase [Bacteroides reticulotermitis]